MSNSARCFVLLALLTGSGVLAEPIKVAPGNPHYYSYQDKPILLITSAEHYGAVINKDFDYVAYLDDLQAHGLNYTRFYPGAMFEPVGKFMAGNTLGPKPGSLVVPWARSDTPGYRLGGNRFDLDRGTRLTSPDSKTSWPRRDAGASSSKSASSTRNTRTPGRSPRCRPGTTSKARGAVTGARPRR